MKKVSIILILLFLIAFLNACGVYTETEDIRIEKYDRNTKIYTDKETGCKYVVLIRDGGGITPLLNNQGKPDCSGQ